MFEIDYSPSSKKFLQTQDKFLSERILEKIKLLQEAPVPHNAVRVEGQNRTFRIRIGKYRVLYEIKWELKIIYIKGVDKRSRIYDP